MMEPRLETPRLVLRPWSEGDAPVLYEYARDPRVGPIAGWPPHASVEMSRGVIGDVLSAPGTFAVVWKETGLPAGCVGLMIGAQSNLHIGPDEGELGFWVGVPFWGRGIAPEAARELMRYAFEEKSLAALWCGYFEGNERSRRVQEKLGFAYHHTNENIHWELMNDIRTEHVSRLSSSEWMRQSAERSVDPGRSIAAS